MPFSLNACTPFEGCKPKHLFPSIFYISASLMCMLPRKVYEIFTMEKKGQSNHSEGWATGKDLHSYSSRAALLNSYVKGSQQLLWYALTSQCPHVSPLCLLFTLLGRRIIKNEHSNEHCIINECCIFWIYFSVFYNKSISWFNNMKDI